MVRRPAAFRDLTGQERDQNTGLLGLRLGWSCLDQRKSEGLHPTAGINSLGLEGVPQVQPGIDGVVGVEMTELQLGDLTDRQTEVSGGEPELCCLHLKLSLTFDTVQVVTEAPQSPVNLPPAPDLNLQIRNEVAQVEVGVPELGDIHSSEVERVFTNHVWATPSRPPRQ